jgi:hypothetical protein
MKIVLIPRKKSPEIELNSMKHYPSLKKFLCRLFQMRLIAQTPERD